MQKYYAPTEAVCSDARDLQNCVTADLVTVYLASDVDARIAELEKALREIADMSGLNDDILIDAKNVAKRALMER
jgi:hypothetical protein